jgi:hypothetical protein
MHLAEAAGEVGGNEAPAKALINLAGKEGSTQCTDAEYGVEVNKLWTRCVARASAAVNQQCFYEHKHGQPQPPHTQALSLHTTILVAC